jgi:hypothetical protein
MANFVDSPHFETHNDYYTPKSAWENIKYFVDRKGYKKVFEAFMLNSNEQSKKNLEELGYEVLGDKNVDFLNEETQSPEIINKEYDIIISNPPFERVSSFKNRKDNLKYRCIQRLFELDKPFIIIMNSLNIFSGWFAELVNEKDIKFIFPSTKIEFDKFKEGGEEKMEKKNKKSNCSFYSIYVCYKVLDKNEFI